MPQDPEARSLLQCGWGLCLAGDRPFLFGMDASVRPLRGAFAALLAAAALAACNDDPSGLTLRPVTSGTIGGVPFTVTGGTVYQASPGGPLRADEGGGQIVLDESPAELGMSDPDLLHLRTEFAVSNGGSLQIAAFGDDGAEFSTGVWVVLTRDTTALDYEFRLSGALFADSTFTPPPAIPSAEHWLVTEFYADSVPGYPAGQSGITMWELNDLTPGLAEDVLGCDPGPATDPTPLAGDRVGYSLRSVWLLSVEVVDQIVGPCV
jgi:hypothetical protein